MILFAVLLLAACSSPRQWQYSVESSPLTPQPVLAKTVAVPPFRDSRPDENEAALSMYLIPLMPFGWVDLSIPETGGGKLTSTPVWKFEPTEDLAKAAAQELQASGLFQRVSFTERALEEDLVFCGDVKSTRYWGTMLTYGFSLAGPLLWVLGFPVGTVHNQLAVDFSLEDRGAGLTLWHKSYDLTYDREPFWHYNLPSDFEYDRLFKRMMREAIESLRSDLSRDGKAAG